MLCFVFCVFGLFFCKIRIFDVFTIFNQKGILGRNMVVNISLSEVSKTQRRALGFQRVGTSLNHLGDTLQNLEKLV